MRLLLKSSTPYSAMAANRNLKRITKRRFLEAYFREHTYNRHDGTKAIQGVTKTADVQAPMTTSAFFWL
jgi:DNA primase catalytic subunit